MGGGIAHTLTEIHKTLLEIHRARETLREAIQQMRQRHHSLEETQMTEREYLFVRCFVVIVADAAAVVCLA